MGEYIDEDLKKLEDEKKIVEELLDIGYAKVAEGILTEKDLWDLLEKRYDLEQAITEEKKKQAEENGKILDQELIRLHRERRQLMLEMRKTGMMEDPAMQKQVLNYEIAIANRMRDLGMSEDDIRNELRALKVSHLPQFATGTPTTLSKDTVAQLHKGEKVINKEQMQRWIKNYGSKAHTYLDQPMKMTADLSKIIPEYASYMMLKDRNEMLKTVINNNNNNINLELQVINNIEGENPMQILATIENNINDIVEKGVTKTFKKIGRQLSDL